MSELEVEDGCEAHEKVAEVVIIKGENGSDRARERERERERERGYYIAHTIN